MTQNLGENNSMSFDEYLDFLDEYWEIFGPIKPNSREDLGVDLFKDIRL